MDARGARKRFRNDHDTSTRPRKAKKAEKVDDSLSLVGRDLTAAGEGSPDLSTHSNLHKLDLHDSKVDKLAFVAQAKATLTLLNLSGVRGIDSFKGLNELAGLFVLNISNCGLKKVPRQVASLSSLKALIATHNDLSSLDQLDDLSNLNTLVVSHNKLKALPPVLAHLKQLKKISCAHCALTTAGLPDLSSLPLLHELRLNDNRSLSKLPPYFGLWGRANEALGKRSGLEIVDLGNCAFDDWFALKELADQSNIANLNIKGNPVVQEASSDFEDYKQKMLVLLPNLKVLDGHRFDAKFSDLKAKRDQRSEAERILDAGPIAIARNAASHKPVDLAQAEKKRLKGKLRATGGNATAVPARDAPAIEPSPEPAEPPTEPVDEEPAEPVKLKKRRKNRHDKPKPAEEDTPDVDEPAEAKEPKAAHPDGEPATADGDAEVEEKEIFRKRGRKSKFLQERGGATKAPYAIARPEAAEAAPRPAKDPRGLLAALRGDDEGDETDERRAKKPTEQEARPPVPNEPQEAKETKTSVVKVVQVKKKKKEKKAVDVSDLLKRPAAPAPIAGWD